MLFEMLLLASMNTSIALYDSMNDHVKYIKADKVKIVYIKG